MPGSWAWHFTMRSSCAMIIQRLPLTVATATGSLAVEGDEKPLTAFDR
jgi:hypothetical protein